MAPKIVKSTSKGQITLPKSWRDKFATDVFVVETEDNQLVIKPLLLDQEEVVFDADRDNDGKGVPVDDMIRMLKDIQS